MTRLVIACVLLLAPARAAAHDLIAEVDATADPVRVVAGFDTGMPAEGAKATVTAADGRLVAAGVLDERGVWAFARPGPGVYKVVVEDPAGHRDERTLTVPETGEVTADAPDRLDKRLGLALGLGGLLGATGLYVWARRKR